MSRYIDVEKLKENFEKESESATDLFDAFDFALEETPTADVEEVKHGKWIPLDYLSDIEYNHFRCSLCGRHTKIFKRQNINEDKPYCHCGAKMDLR